MLTVPLRSKRRERAVLLQKMQHAAPGVMLLFAGLQAIQEQVRGFALALALFEIVTSALLLGSVVIALKKARRPADHAQLPHLHHGGVDWIDVFTAAMLFVEAAEHWHLTHHVARPTMLMAIVLMTVGLFHGRIKRRAERRFTVRVGADDLYLGGKPFRSIHRKWADLASIDIGPRWAIIMMRGGGQRKLDLLDLEGAHHVRGALEEARRRVAAAALPGTANTDDAKTIHS